MFVLPLAPVARRTALVDRLFDETFDRFIAGTRAFAEARTPALDVAETADHYTLTLDLPGARKADIRVSVEGRRVSISTAREVQAEPAQPTDVTAIEAPAAATEPSTTATTAPQAPARRVIHRERSDVAYARTVVLPSEVEGAGSQAAFDNGVLTLTLAKKAPNRATQLIVA